MANETVTWNEARKLWVTDDGRILADRFETHGHTTGVNYEPVPRDMARPWDADRGEHLRRGQTYMRLSSQGWPVGYAGRFYVDPTQVEDYSDGWQVDPFGLEADVQDEPF